ncbi:MAG TPA: DUF2252 family protein [Candidatus Sulfotelmatobacter sp.]|nr:DUF2252 family protein [Candidatus Sulfotelmatobacter sp.]
MPKDAVDVVAATRAYETWVGEHLTLVRADLRAKHRAMAGRPFPFLRATFYRWMQLWPSVCAGLGDAPEVLAVGDLHIENFGTWRDVEGRLVWGVNDFDETYPLPYTLDLVRLAASAVLAARDGMLGLGPRTIATCLIGGYRKAIEAGGRPYVLEETHAWMRTIALSSLRDPVAFWAKLDRLPTYEGALPKKVRKLLERDFPEPGLKYRVMHRTAGLGSLGRQRFVALADLHGAMIAREAKALLPSACVWARDGAGSGRVRYADILAQAVRCPDPYMRVRGSWVVRRLSAHSSKLDLSLMPRRRDERRLLHAMGGETANIHLGTPGVRRAIRRDLERRSASWLDRAARAMADAVTADWRRWRNRTGARSGA